VSSMSSYISGVVQEIPPSGIRKFFDLVTQTEGVISLGVGEPDFVTPWHIREACFYSLEKGYTMYTSNLGLPELREEIAAYEKRKIGVSYSPADEILVTVGVSEAVDLALRALVEPGDEVLVPEPSYVSYAPGTKLVYVNPRNILDCLEKGITPVVAGFQGLSENGEITTLGRGGSDTTASALGVALNAEIIDIFTDVEGIMTADPRIVTNARLLEAISYNEICQLAREGARVVHPRAIEIAMQGNVPLRVRSTSLDSPGTLIGNQLYHSNGPHLIKDQLITGITYTSHLTQIKIEDSNNSGKLELNVFKSLAAAGISVDFISVQLDRIVFTVQSKQVKQAGQVLKNIDIEPAMETDCAKVAVVGAAMTGIPGVMANVVAALTEQEINILQSGDSYTNIWCLVKETDLEKAVNALHDKFELGI
jgi:aspartate kinase